MAKRVLSDYDSPWKEALDVYFESFMELCFPHIHRDIDWQRGYESWDTELREIIRDAEIGNRVADKLVKVWLHDGEEVFVLIHVEIQTQYQKEFPRRMHVSNNRISDKYGREVISLAVLGDDDKNWRPTRFAYTRWGFISGTKYLMVKLLDFQPRWSELELSLNPFAVVIMAHLSTLETLGKPNQRFQSKLTLVRGLYERGYTKNEILELFRLIQWMMVLPKPLEISFKQEFKRIQEEGRVPYITDIELDGMVKATRESVVTALRTRFGVTPTQVSERLEAIEDLDVLRKLLEQSITIASVEEFQLRLNEIPLSEEALE
ncbi:hypothetical protein DSM106972_072060 [Dulcicalothrix desertica PCC 7102]|uniref:Transposase n=1 Tax=Dulcicalothrix desertica PCC 7102 TaxID=232991 RepID=A0A3S1AHH5_9CYAN|nr:transposase [Dulcicalothrix desertica]RUT00797.1 hypothetical protein DSM106972_072060 [Dulcicalothrix desertica PCC 7102]TWH42359.1 smoothelin cytoskeleton protein [Dulcicalothrix desertica PCC 7102]